MPNDQFCAKCGAPVGQGKFSEIVEDTPENNVVDTCGKCGSGVTEGQMFCTECGKSLIGGDEAGDD
jgi:RNase P subunit RPR2